MSVSKKLNRIFLTENSKKFSGQITQNDKQLLDDIIAEYRRVQGLKGEFPDVAQIRVSELSSKAIDQAEKILDIELMDDDMLNVFWKDASPNDISGFPNVTISLILNDEDIQSNL